MTDDEIDHAARHLLTDVVVRRVQPGTDEWHELLAKRFPETRLTDQKYITMGTSGLIEERRREQ